MLRKKMIASRATVFGISCSPSPFLIALATGRSGISSPDTSMFPQENQTHKGVKAQRATATKIQKGCCNTVYSRYIAVGGVQAMLPRYKWERDISGDCHEPKSGSIFPCVVSYDRAYVCLVANSASRQRI